MCVQRPGCSDAERWSQARRRDCTPPMGLRLWSRGFVESSCGSPARAFCMEVTFAVCNVGRPILSVKQLADKGARVEFGEGGALIKKGGREARAKSKAGMYLLDVVGYVYQDGQGKLIAPALSTSPSTSPSPSHSTQPPHQPQHQPLPTPMVSGNREWPPGSHIPSRGGTTQQHQPPPPQQPPSQPPAEQQPQSMDVEPREIDEADFRAAAAQPEGMKEEGGGARAMVQQQRPSAEAVAVHELTHLVYEP